MIITKYYDGNLKLKTFNPNSKAKITNLSFIRFKVLNEKEWPCCDFEGKCENKAHAEVYPFLMKKSNKKGWSYLCKKHYLNEQKRSNWKLPACLSVEW